MILQNNQEKNELNLGLKIGESGSVSTKTYNCVYVFVYDNDNCSSGYISEHSAYHHGEASLTQTIIGKYEYKINYRCGHWSIISPFHSPIPLYSASRQRLFHFQAWLRILLVAIILIFLLLVGSLVSTLSGRSCHTRILCTVL